MQAAAAVMAEAPPAALEGREELGATPAGEAPAVATAAAAAVLAAAAKLAEVETSSHTRCIHCKLLRQCSRS